MYFISSLRKNKNRRKESRKNKKKHMNKMFGIKGFIQNVKKVSTPFLHVK